MEVRVSRPIEYSQRLAPQLARAAIKGDIVRALVELITNSDDSYRRMEQRGLPTSGLIQVETIRKHKGSIIRVIDQAEGFDAQTMDERIGRFGEDTSGFTQGIGVRGYFGRGLKEAILALGRGAIRSIKDDYLYECALDKNKYEGGEPKKLTKALHGEFSGLGILGHGAEVTVVIEDENIRVPQFENLAYQLERYFSLRDINSSRRRTVELIEKDNQGRVRRKEKLEYKYPIGEMIMDKEIELKGAYEGIKVQIGVYKAKQPLDQEGPCCEGGLLICGSHAIHDITLFRYETNLYAARLYGRVTCKHVDELIRKDEPVISDRRDGLDLGHPFCKALKEKVEEELKSVVDALQKEEEQKQKQIENERTRQRFLSAIKRINEIAKKELAQEGEGRGEGEDEITKVLPPNGFDFVPPYYHIIAGNRSTLTLKAVVPWMIPSGSVINLESDNEDIEIESKTVTVYEETAQDGVVTINPKVVGKSVGSEGVITATVLSKDFKAEALIVVVSKREIVGPGEKKREKKEGIFNGIKYDPTLSPKVRHYFDPEARIIKISTKAPSVATYLGPIGENQDEPHCQVLVAELVTDAVCWEIARRKQDMGKLSFLGEDYTGAIKREHTRLVAEYAHLIHQVIVSPEARKRIVTQTV